MGGENGQDGKLASAYSRVQAAGRRTDEDLRKHSRFSTRAEIERKLLYTWKYQFEGRPEPRHANLGTTPEERKDKQLREEISKLKSALAEKTLENDFWLVWGICG